MKVSPALTVTRPGFPSHVTVTYTGIPCHSLLTGFHYWWVKGPCICRHIVLTWARANHKAKIKTNWDWLRARGWPGWRLILAQSTAHQVWRFTLEQPHPLPLACAGRNSIWQWQGSDRGRGTSAQFAHHGGHIPVSEALSSNPASTLGKRIRRLP